MQVLDTKLTEVKIIKCSRKLDARGSTQVTFHQTGMADLGIEFFCKEQRLYRSPKKGTFYGIHFQSNRHPQAKLIHVLAGGGIDYVIDLRKESPTYTQWIAVGLQEGDDQQIFIPQGFGHAFLSLEDNTALLFSVDEHFHENSAIQIRYDDVHINLILPIPIEAMSDYDRNAPYLDELEFEV